MSDIRQGDIHPRQEPLDASEDPLMRWLRYGMGDLFYAVAKERGLGSLHVFQFLVNEAVGAFPSEPIILNPAIQTAKNAKYAKGEG